MRLSLACGRADVEAFLDEITEANISEWMMFFRAEPWGAEIEWLRTGTIASMIANMSGNRRQGAPALKAVDFVPKPPPARRATVDPRATREALRAVFGPQIKLGRQHHARPD